MTCPGRAPQPGLLAEGGPLPRRRRSPYLGGDQWGNQDVKLAW